ncbi:MAG: hypothetical protein WD990_12395 [Acidimicrobiia bacterium]
MTDTPRTNPNSTVGELQEMIDVMIVHLEEAKSMPLSANVLVDRDEFLSMLHRMRAALPDELRAARWMVREREAFVARTNERAQEIIDRAKSESRRLVSESYVLAEAVEEANILVRRAEGEARRMRLEAEDEIEANLEKLESMLASVLTRVHGARAELHEARPASPQPPI